MTEDSFGQVQVHFYAAARAAVGTSVVTTPGGSLAGILEALCQDFPALQAVWPRCSFLIDEVAVHGDPADIRVESGSRIDVLPPFAGG